MEYSLTTTNLLAATVADSVLILILMEYSLTNLSNGERTTGYGS